MTGSEQTAHLARTAQPACNDVAMSAFTAQRKAHWDKQAQEHGGKPRGMSSRCYHRWLEGFYAFLVPQGLRVCEIGCDNGDLLASLAPSHGVGVDFSPAMLDVARKRHPHLTFRECDAHCVDALATEGPFDVIILSDLVNDLWDVQTVLDKVHCLCGPKTRIILNFYSKLWEWPLRYAQGLGMAVPNLTQNWLTPDDIENMLNLADMEAVREFNGFVWPFNTPLLGPLFNKYLTHLWPFNMLTLAHVMVCRPLMPSKELQTVSVIIPARNEMGNIEDAIARTPEMGAGTEIIFVEGNSTDDTWGTIQKLIAKHPERNCKAFQQTGKGKGDAVRLGFAKATGDILMILDADLTVPPEDLPLFYRAIQADKAEFVNGVRLVYPQDAAAMRFCNLVANKLFSIAFSWLLGMTIKDTLCGTKVLSREHYKQIADNRTYFGEFDPFGDYDLLFGAAKQNLKILDIPIRYRERTYGDTNISRWRDGWLLLKMVCFAARRIKFVP